MSGGSWDYMYWKMDDATDIVSLIAHGRSAPRMVERLEREEHGRAAAMALDEMIKETEKFVAKIESMGQELRPVLKAVEWVDSNDWGHDRLEKELKKFRAPDPEMPDTFDGVVQDAKMASETLRRISNQLSALMESKK